MGDDPHELRETFDGYLMFDFSNFHGLMAQTFEEPDEPGENNHQAYHNSSSYRKPSDAPGPYLVNPPHDLDQQDGDDADIMFDMNEDGMGDVYDDDDQCMSNLQNSEFNLLANLDFEPDDDAYENGINLTGNDPSTNNMRMKSTSERQKKISIFSPTMHYEDNQELDKRIQIINIQNIEILKEEFNFDDFYRFLRRLDFLNFDNLKCHEDHMKIDQLITMVEIRIQFEKMCDMFQKWTQLTPSISFSSRLQFFQLQLDHFIDMVNYIIDNGTAKQNHFQPREGLATLSQANHQSSFQAPQAQANAQQKWALRHSELMNAAHIVKSHTLSMSVAFFKAVEIMEEYKTFLHFRNRSQQFKDLTRFFHLIKSWHLFARFCKVSCIQIYPRKVQQTQKLVTSTKLTNSANVEEQNDPSSPRKLDWMNDASIQKKIKGLDSYFTAEVRRNPPIPMTKPSGEDGLQLHRRFRDYNQSVRQRSLYGQYLERSLITEYDY